MKKLLFILCTGVLLAGLAACGTQSGGQSARSVPQTSQSSAASSQGSASASQPQTQGSGSQSETGSQSDASQTPASQPDASQSTSSQTDEARQVTLYIGTGDQFQQYEETYQGTLNELGMVPPEGVVAEMAKLTGWNLDLASEITTGKGGITVTFASTCALFSGPPEVQKEQFHVYDSYQLDQTILDSVKKTLQNWAVVPGKGDPDSVDVYYCGPDGKDLVLINSGWTISSTQPYEYFPKSR